MVLSAQEESLIGVVRAFPPEEAGKILNWACQLADLAGERAIDWSDSWTDEDLADASAAAVRRFEDQEQADRLKPGDVVVCAFPGRILQRHAQQSCSPRSLTSDIGQTWS